MSVSLVLYLSSKKKLDPPLLILLIIKKKKKETQPTLTYHTYHQKRRICHKKRKENQPTLRTSCSSDLVHQPRCLAVVSDPDLPPPSFSACKYLFLKSLYFSLFEKREFIFSSYVWINLFKLLYYISYDTSEVTTKSGYWLGFFPKLTGPGGHVVSVL